MSAAKSAIGVERGFAPVDALSLSSADVRRLSREAAAAASVDARVAFMGDVTLQPLAEFVAAHLLCQGAVAKTLVTPFGQTLEVILDPRSPLRSFEPNFLFLHMDSDTIAARLRASSGDSKQRSRAILDSLLPILWGALEHTRATLLVTNFVEPDSYEYGIADSRAEDSELATYADLNVELPRTFRDEPRVQIVNLARLTALFGRSRVRDPRLYYLAKMPWHESFLPVLADEVVRHICATLGRVRKCLVVDLDNTLWSGVVGEDGAEGILIGSGDPAGEAFKTLQNKILALKKRGILLAACSKNNPAEVDEVFEMRAADMSLTREDFVCMQIGWDSKVAGLQRIAQQLNIGTDSLVFLDDNPAELALIRRAMPEVLTVMVPKDVALVPTCLDRVHGFDRVHITAEDREKTLQYRQNAERNAERAQFTDLKGYLESLETQVEIRRVDASLLPRAHQLFSKTNQFNLTTRRYSPAEIESIAANPGARLIMAHAKDRFGDIGWIGAAVVEGLMTPTAEIAAFVLSCRAMGRGIETAMLNYLKKECFELNGCERIVARFIPTPKNVPVVTFYEEEGFAVTEKLDSGEKKYELRRRDGSYRDCSWLTITCSHTDSA